MKGITPVITTVLLLLMAVAAVGGAWVWYQKMQTSAIAGGSGQVDQLRKTAVSISPEKIVCDSGNYNVTLANVGTESTTLTELKLTNSTGTIGTQTTAAQLALPANVFTVVNVSKETGMDCVLGKVYYISARIGAQYVIKDYPVTVTSS